ncbi:microtubule-actin cross-linking factor 1, isoforms 6/7-like [Apteryx mantelli]|uniref:Microtubule-actin cross-linking factor 1, isoforms 6/7-like n=1 Tax=Apteryx mantelli TaxID=2696672 RepID=A0ABM4FSB9_9AVES
MGKPLSRPDCLRQNPTCLGKGEEEDGYIEDCYVPQRSIYDTMRINEQIDQGSKLNQPSKSTLDKVDSSTISSNGTLGASNVFESRPPETKKLDERVIFDALKLSSDVSKSAPAPPRRRPNPERKENVNRRSWKSFMPPNFPEFAERIEASLSEVSEAGASNPSLQEKRESSAMLAESSGHSDHGEPMSESLTLEHVSKSAGTAEVSTAKHLNEDCCDYSQDECQPLLNPEDIHIPVRDFSRGRRLPSATWPRTRKNFIRGSLSDGHQETLEASETDCTVENVNLSPCLSEELLDSGLNILITSNLREKTESELRFEEDERWVMMEEWEEATLSERGKTVLLTDEKKNCCLADISEEREQLATTVDPPASVPGTAHDGGVLGPPLPHELPVPAAVGGADCPLAGSTRSTEDVAVQCEAEDFAPNLGCSASPVVPEQFSDTDSVQMFLELEKQCLNEEEGDGAVSLDLEVQVSVIDSEGPDPQTDSEKIAEAAIEACEHLAPFEASASDSAVVSDLEDFDGTYSSQVVSTVEPATEPYSERETSAITPTDSDGAVSPSPVAAVGTTPVRCTSSSMEEDVHGPLVDQEPWDACAVVGLVPCGATASPEADTSRVSGLEGTISLSDFSALGNDDNQDLLVAGSAIAQLSEETCPGSVSPAQSLPCWPPALDTGAEELGSPQDCSLLKDVEGTEVSDSPEKIDRLLSERTELTNWDISELVSEDEVMDLEKESDGSEGQSHPAESMDGRCGSLTPFRAGSALEQGSEAQLTRVVSAEGLAPETLPWGQALVLAAHMEGSSPSMAIAQEAAPAAFPPAAPAAPVPEAGVLQPGDLDLLFAYAWEDRLADGLPVHGQTPSPTPAEHVCVVPSSIGAFGEEEPGAGSPPPSTASAIPDTWEGLPGALLAAGLLDFGEDLAVLEPSALEMPPATGDAAMDAEEPYAWCPTLDADATAMVVEEPLEAPAPFADEPAAAVPPPPADLPGVQVPAPEDPLSGPMLPAAGKPGMASESAAERATGTEPPGAHELPEEAPAPLEAPGASGMEGPAEPGATPAPGALRAPGHRDASPPAPGEAAAAAGTKGPPAAALAADGPPAPADGFVPDNEAKIADFFGKVFLPASRWVAGCHVARRKCIRRLNPVKEITCVLRALTDGGVRQGSGSAALTAAVSESKGVVGVAVCPSRCLAVAAAGLSARWDHGTQSPGR